jgi:multidrug efflux pump subunit AcrA (membrane-fusion protein)
MHYQRLGIAVLAATLGLGGCGKGGGAPQTPPLSVDAAAATRQNIATYITLDGQIAPKEQSTLAFQQSGTVVKVTVNIGDVVHKGALLAEIDPSTLQAQLSQAQAQASQQSASAQGASVGLPVQVQNNNAALVTAKAALENAKLVYDQNKQLFKQGYVSQTALQQSEAQYVQAQSTYANSVVGLRNNVVSAENVKAQQASAVAAQAQANVLSTQLSQTTVYAPFDGVISNRLLDPGAYAGPSQPVLQISRTDIVWININVPDEDLAYVQPGTVVRFKTSSLGDRQFSGRIQTVNAVPTSGTLSYLARLQLSNPGDVLRGGMLIDATLVRQQANDAIVVPRSAVADSENGSLVYAIESGKAVAVPVRVGVQTDTLAQVMSPRIQAGTQVITTRPDALKDGSVVLVNSGQAAPAPSATKPAKQ